MVKVRSAILAPTVIVVFVIGIVGSMLLNFWNTESKRIPVKFSSGEFAGMSNPADIRGSYSFDNVAAAFDVPVAVLARAFGVSDLPEPGEFQAKSLETLYAHQADGGEVGTDAVRHFTALYAGLPHLPEESTRLPGPALAELETRLSSADLDAVRPIIVPLADLTGPAEPAADDPASEVPEAEHDENEMVIRGKTTFGDLLDWGLSREQIEDALGMEMGVRAETIRDFLVEEGMEFSTYKTLFQDLLESGDAAVRE